MIIRFRGENVTTTAITTAKAISSEIILEGTGTDLVFSIKNTSENALTDLQLRVKANKDDAFGILVSGTEWATLNAHLKAVEGTLHTLAGSNTIGRAHVSIGPWYSIQFWASAGTAAVTEMKINVRCEG